MFAGLPHSKFLPINSRIFLKRVITSRSLCDLPVPVTESKFGWSDEVNNIRYTDLSVVCINNASNLDNIGSDSQFNHSSHSSSASCGPTVLIFHIYHFFSCTDYIASIFISHLSKCHVHGMSLNLAWNQCISLFHEA